jgi:hypothetical protein
VRDDWETVSARETNNSDGPPETSVLDGGVLAALPRTRPQRSSPRRAAARTSTAIKTKKPAGAQTARATKQPAGAKTPTAVKRTPTTSKRATKPSARTAEKPATAKRPTAVKQAPASTKRAAKSSAKPPEPPTPKQGYEPEEEVELGNTVNPPSGVELVESVADIVGELANSGIAAGGRVLKDVFSLLRRP